VTAALLTLALADSWIVNHEFIYVDAKAKSVAVAGTFNNWNKSAHPMKRDLDGKTWRRELPIQAGSHQYKYVINNSDWLPDPNGKNRDDGSGNINTFIDILPEGYEQPARKGDSIVTKSGISNKPADGDLWYSRQNQTVRIICRTRRGDVEQVRVVINGQRYAMKRMAGDKLQDIYGVTLPSQNLTGYTIEFLDGAGIHHAHQVADIDLSTFAEPEVPQWPNQGVFYQIFPDRFANGSKVNDPAEVEPWGAKPTYSNFMGGDLAGIDQRIPYLTELGITGLYLNPIFLGPSNHGYETTDYLQIEPRLGTNQEFGDLTRKLKRSGIAVVLDGVFNHTSTDFEAFRQIVSKGKQAKTLDWYTVKSFPVVRKKDPPYEAWAGFESMPKLNVMNEDTKKFLLAVPEFWHQNAEIAGWRLDVANEVAEPFWQEFRTKTKSLKSDLWIIGENWTDSSKWLKGDQWDSTMNYPFREAVLNFFARKTTSATEFLDELMACSLMYAPSVNRNLLNNIGTHDTPRIKTLCEGSQPCANLAAITMFAWPGVPCIYYGDEIGMDGGPDPENRRAMHWDQANATNPTLGLYRRLILARKSCLALQQGEVHPLLADDAKQIIAFARRDGNQVALVVLNRSQQARQIDLGVGDLALPSSLIDVVSGKAMSFSGGPRLHAQIPAESALLLVPSVGSTVTQSNPGD
jgi:glycosidase